MSRSFEQTWSTVRKWESGRGRVDARVCESWSRRKTSGRRSNNDVLKNFSFMVGWEIDAGIWLPWKITKDRRGIHGWSSLSDPRSPGSPTADSFFIERIHRATATSDDRPTLHSEEDKTPRVRLRVLLRLNDQGNNFRGIDKRRDGSIGSAARKSRQLFSRVVKREVPQNCGNTVGELACETARTERAYRIVSGIKQCL